MPWYYAGPDAQPIGPISLEELQNRRAGGVVTSETYVIEQPVPAGQTVAWKRYRDIFPPAMPPPPALPPIPTAAPFPAMPAYPAAPAYPSAPPPFPAPQPVAYGYPSAGPHYMEHRPVNMWCAWGFALGLASFFFAFACGIGLFLAIPGLIVSATGLYKLTQFKAESGRGLAISGIILSVVGAAIALIFIAAIAFPMFKSHGMTTAEETIIDSD